MINPGGSSNCSPGEARLLPLSQGSRAPVALLPRPWAGSGIWLKVGQALAEYMHHSKVLLGVVLNVITRRLG